jgi:Mg2+/Co2+ transporter CorB
MSVDTALLALAILALGAMAFFCAGSEAALSATSRARLLALERQGNHRARRLSRLLDAPEAAIAALLVGSRLALGCAVALIAGAVVLAHGPLGFVYAVAAVIVLTAIVEALPRRLALHDPDRFALAVSRPMRSMVHLLLPIAAAFNTVARVLSRLAGVKVGKGLALVTAREELRGTVDLMHREGSVEKIDRDMLGGLLDLQDLSVADVMVHRTKMYSFDLAQGPGAIVQAVLAAPYTRIPVWRDQPDNIVGVIHTKDLVRALDAVGNDALRLDLEAIARPVWFVPGTTSLVDQLKSFRRRKMHFAVVVDEYGVMLGIVTLEDIIEEIVGDISDEHDVAMSGVRPQLDGVVNVDGSVPIRDLNRAMDWSLPDDEATTIAGLVIHEARTIPEPGQTFTFHGLRIQVLRKSRNRITALRITPVVGG